MAMGTQWRSSGFGATGLDYMPLWNVMQVVGVKRSERSDTFQAVRIMEDSALQTMHYYADRARERSKAKSSRRG